MAREHPARAFTNLAHYIDLDWLREAYRQTRKDGATGVDGVTGKEYEKGLEENLQALAETRSTLMRRGGGWVVEADIRDCFGAFDHSWVRKILDQRIRDGVLLRTIGKWLNAGIMEDGQRTRPEEGTPQGGGVSPLLANIVLHTVLDMWFERHAKPKARGHVKLIRFADAFVILCDNKEDAERFYAGIFPRFAKFGLELHPEKTKLVPFKRPPSGGPNDSESWDFLGFTHYWSRSRKGNWAVFRKTMASRLSRALNKIAEWCRKNRHLPIREQHRTLSRKLRGHCAYYGITGNSAALQGVPSQELGMVGATARALCPASGDRHTLFHTHNS